MAEPTEASSSTSIPPLEPAEASSTSISALEGLPSEVLLTIFEYVSAANAPKQRSTHESKKNPNAKKEVELLLVPIHISAKLRSFMWTCRPIWRLIAKAMTVGPSCCLSESGFHSLFKLCDERSDHTLSSITVQCKSATNTCCQRMKEYLDLVKKSQASLQTLILPPTHSLRQCTCPQCTPTSQRFITKCQKTPEPKAKAAKMGRRKAQQASKGGTVDSNAEGSKTVECYCSDCCFEPPTVDRYVRKLLAGCSALKELEVYLTVKDWQAVWSWLESDAAKPLKLRFGAPGWQPSIYENMSLCKTMASRTQVLSLHCDLWDQLGFPASDKAEYLSPAANLYKTIMHSSASSLRHLDLDVFKAQLPVEALTETSFPFLETLFVHFLNFPGISKSPVFPSNSKRAPMPSLHTIHAPASVLNLIDARTVVKAGILLESGTDHEAVNPALTKWTRLETLALYTEQIEYEVFEELRWRVERLDATQQPGDFAVPRILEHLLYKEGKGYPCWKLQDLALYRGASPLAEQTMGLQQLPRPFNWRQFERTSDHYHPSQRSRPGLFRELAKIMRQRRKMAKVHPTKFKPLRELRSVGWRINRWDRKQLRQAPPPFKFTYLATPHFNGSSATDSDRAECDWSQDSDWVREAATRRKAQGKGKGKDGTTHAEGSNTKAKIDKDTFKEDEAQVADDEVHWRSDETQDDEAVNNGKTTFPFCKDKPYSDAEFRRDFMGMKE